MRLHWRALELPYRRGHFTISADTSQRAHTIVVVGREQDAYGMGEATPSARVTGQDAAAVQAGLEQAAVSLQAVRVEASERPPPHPLKGASGPVSCAIDGVRLDAWAKAHDKPLWRLLDLPRPKAATSATLSLATPEAMADEARHHLAAGFHVLKIKLGTGPDEDLRRLHAVREAAPRAVLRVDGNEAWSLDDAVTLLPAFAEAGVELVEQPLARGASDDAMRRLTELCADFEVAHVLDERVHGPADAHAIGKGRLAHGINLKLQKSGGLRNGLRVIRAAKDEGLGIMMGCFVETWAGIALALQACGHVDWVDLDGAWLLAEDPVRPVGEAMLEEGFLRGLDAAGLGLAPGPALARLFDAPTTSL